MNFSTYLDLAVCNPHIRTHDLEYFWVNNIVKIGDTLTLEDNNNLVTAVDGKKVTIEDIHQKVTRVKDTFIVADDCAFPATSFVEFYNWVFNSVYRLLI